MDLKKVSQFEPVISSEKPELRKPNGAEKGIGPSFAETLNGLQGGLQKAAKPAIQTADPVKFSNHAVERMHEQRHLILDQEDITRLNEAVDRAAAKGSKDTL
jgi:hypothetical protein